MKVLLLWIMLAATILIGVFWDRYPLEDSSDRLTSLPINGPNFSGKEIPLTPFEKTFFSSIKLLKRSLTVDNHAFYLFVLDGTHNRHLVHDPFFCFKGAGWKILNYSIIPIPGGEATRLTIEKEGKKEEALFWFSDEKARFASAWQYFFSTTLRRISLGSSGKEPLLIILITQKSSTSIDWNAILKDVPPLLTL